MLPQCNALHSLVVHVMVWDPQQRVLYHEEGIGTSVYLWVLMAVVCVRADQAGAAQGGRC